MPTERTKNHAETTVAVAYTAGGTSLEVADGDKLPALTGDDQFTVLVYTQPAAGGVAANPEIMRVTARAGNVLTVTPAVEEVRDQQAEFDHPIGDRVLLVLTADSLPNLINQILAVHEAGTSSVHGITNTALLTTAAAVLGTDNRLLRSDGSDRGIQSSGITVDDSDNVTIPGNLTVAGTTTTFNTDNLTVEDPLIKLGEGNSADVLDLGWFAQYNDGSERFCGLFRDASNGKFRLFYGLLDEPTTTVNIAGLEYALGELVLGSLEVSAAITATAITVSNGGLRMRDASDDHVIEIITDQDNDADYLLWLRMNNGDRVLDLIGSLTVAAAATVSGTNTGDQFTSVAASTLLGRGSASGTGAAQAIALGANLSMSGTTLNATGFTAATQAEQETGTSTTVGVTPGRQHFHTSAAKAWINFTGTGTVTTNGSYNMDAVTDNGTGDYTVNFTTDFSNAHYAFAINGGPNALTSGQLAVGPIGQAMTTSAFRLYTVTTAGSFQDAERISASFYGDHA